MVLEDRAADAQPAAQPAAQHVPQPAVVATNIQTQPTQEDDGLQEEDEEEEEGQQGQPTQPVLQPQPIQQAQAVAPQIEPVVAAAAPALQVNQIPYIRQLGNRLFHFGQRLEGLETYRREAQLTGAAARRLEREIGRAYKSFNYECSKRDISPSISKFLYGRSPPDLLTFFERNGELSFLQLYQRIPIPIGLYVFQAGRDPIYDIRMAMALRQPVLIAERFDAHRAAVRRGVPIVEYDNNNGGIPILIFIGLDDFPFHEDLDLILIQMQLDQLAVLIYNGAERITGRYTRDMKG
ncbi:MAG: hypothetical protein LBS15_03145 [Endomicrobium sp.]|jgi:hypothetical protein|nr:hypothetical protein [Endomicrobium sp.]